MVFAYLLDSGDTGGRADPKARSRRRWLLSWASRPAALSLLLCTPATLMRAARAKRFLFIVMYCSSFGDGCRSPCCVDHPQQLSSGGRTRDKIPSMSPGRCFTCTGLAKHERRYLAIPPSCVGSNWKQLHPLTSSLSGKAKAFFFWSQRLLWACPVFGLLPTFSQQKNSSAPSGLTIRSIEGILESLTTPSDFNKIRIIRGLLKSLGVVRLSRMQMN